MTDRSLDILIDEVVLGLAEDADVARVEEMAARNPAVAAQLDRARARFAPWMTRPTRLPYPRGSGRESKATLTQA